MRYDDASKAEAQRVYQENLTQRAVALGNLEAYADGTYCDGRPSFWDDDHPLRERAPCIVVPVGERAADSNVDLCMGEGRAPSFGYHASEDDSVFDPLFGLTEDDSAILTRFTVACCEQADAIAAFQDALFWSQVHGATCGLVCARNGKLRVDVIDAKWATPTFNEENADDVDRLEIRYPYVDAYQRSDGVTAYRCMLYRRVIDANADVTYRPAVAEKDGREPAGWIEEKRYPHGFGFCPIVWFRNARPSRNRGLDGVAIHARVLDEIHQFNMALSQVHRAAIMSTDPQVVETGVDPDVNPAPSGDIARDGDWVLYDPRGNVAKRGGGKARKRGPGYVWRYPDPNSKVDLLTMPGDALTPASNNARTLYAFLKETLGVVFLDPEQTKLGSDISGRALEWLHSKQIDRCNMLRHRFGRGFILPALSMILRLCHTIKDTLYLPGLAKAKAVLSRFEKDGQWFSPEIKITWGAYFAPTAADAKADVETAQAAKDGGMITQRTSVEKIRAHFPDIGDVDQYLEALEEEAEEKAKKAAEAMHALGDVPPPGEDAPASLPEDKPAPRVRKAPDLEARPAKGKKPPVAKKPKRPPPAMGDA